MAGKGKLESGTPDPGRAHPFNCRDMLSMHRLADPTPSPDWGWIAYTTRSWDEKSNKTTTSLHLVSADGRSTKRLSTGRGHSDTSPTWSPDGTMVAFVSNRGGSKQIWVVRASGGRPRRLVKLPTDVDNLLWSPRGDRIAFSAEVYADGSGLQETASRDKRRRGEPKAMRFDRLFVRHWKEWYTGKRSHLFVLPVRQPSSAGGVVPGGEPKDLTGSLDGDCPTKPFGGREEYCWSPDGSEIAFVTQTGDDRAWSTDLDIYVVASRGGPPRCITDSNRASAFHPVYSPNGRWIAYLSMARPGFEADRTRIALYDRKTGRTKTLTEGWDRSPNSLAWSADSKVLVATAGDTARQKLFAVDVRSGRTRELVSDHHNTLIAVARDNRVLFAQDSLVAPADLWAIGLGGDGVHRLTNLNRERVAAARMSEPEEFQFIGAMAEKVQAWIMKPVNFVAGRKYPVALIIHGGPQTATEDTFHYRWNLQAFAGAGYAVVAINYHGSSGFGQNFTDSISGDWGGKPFEDLMRGLDHALKTYGWLDGDRMAALGASFGGWMVNWINGHTDRFKCLVNHDGGFDQFSFYYSTDELWFPEWEFGGTPWERPELYEKFSPSRYVANWKTPTLVIHGAKDFRLTETEGISTFTALQRRGIPSQLLYFENEGHWVLDARDSILWHDTILSWLDRWLGGPRRSSGVRAELSARRTAALPSI